jgi:predicted nuclease with TOPRIM domain
LVFPVMIHSIIWLLFLGKNIVHFIIFNCIFFLLKATTDLDIREASFNNESKELEESHKEEVEQLIGKNEALSQRIGELSEKMARQTAECDSKLDEMFKAKKAEVGDLRSQLADKESQVKRCRSLQIREELTVANARHKVSAYSIFIGKSTHPLSF